MNRILLIDSSTDLQLLIKASLAPWYHVSVAGSIKKAKEILLKQAIDAILLDVALPDGNGFEYCQELKSDPRTKDIPVLFLTTKSEPIDKMIGFSTGAEDYMVKPFEPIEAKVRIEARIKKNKASSVEKFGMLVFDRIRQRVFVIDETQERDMSFTPFEFKLLYLLASHSGQIFNRSNLLKHLSDPQVHVNDETIYTHISAIRRKLKEYSVCLECIPRLGYRYVPYNVTASNAPVREQRAN